MTSVPSPCNGICRIDRLSGWCLGCRRTIDEITDWPRLSDKGRRAILQKLAGRTPAA